MISKDKAIAISRKHLEKYGIKTFDVTSTKKIDGEIRAKTLTEKSSDFWLVTFSRSTELVGETTGLSGSQIEILNEVAQENNTVTVRVEESGDVEII